MVGYTAQKGRGSAKRAVAARRHTVVPEVTGLVSLLERNASRLSITKRWIIEQVIKEKDERVPQIEKAVAAAGTSDIRALDLPGEGLGEIMTKEGAEDSLDSLTVEDESTDWAHSALLGAGETAERLGVARSTLDNWRRSGKALAFRKGLRNFVFPVEQFDRAKPVEGLAEVRSRFRSDEDAWEWLVAYNRNTGERSPLEWLREGHSDEVIDAAEAALDFA